MLPTEPAGRRTTNNPSEDVFTAIAHPLRRRILETLLEGEQTAGQLSTPFMITRSAISQHLTILLQVGLVTRERRGREQIYHLRGDSLREVQRWIAYFERLWDEKLDQLGIYLDSTALDEDSPHGAAK